MNDQNSIVRNESRQANNSPTASISTVGDDENTEKLSPRLNTNVFIGTDELLKQHRKQLDQFEEWNNQRDWLAFHHHHYDWWMFPIDEISSRGKTYQLPENVIEELRHNENFITDLCRGVRLMVRSWGWNIKDNQPYKNDKCDANQKWSYWPVRLYKAGRCMWLFQQNDYYQSLKTYADTLKNEKLDFFSHTKGGKMNVRDAWDRMENHRSFLDH